MESFWKILPAVFYKIIYIFILSHYIYTFPLYYTTNFRKSQILTAAAKVFYKITPKFDKFLSNFQKI